MKRLLLKLVLRALYGAICIYILNLILTGKNIMTPVGINAVSVATAGLLGIPGVVLMYFVGFFFRLFTV